MSTIIAFPITTVKTSALTDASAATFAAGDKVLMIVSGTPSISTWSHILAQINAQPLADTLTQLSVLTPSTIGLGWFSKANPSATSYPKIGATGLIAFETPTQLRSTISAQPLNANLTTFSSVVPSGLGLSFVRQNDLLTAAYFKGAGDVDQTVQQLTPTELVADLYTNGALASPRVISITSSATPAPNADVTDVFQVTALATAITTFTNPSGSPAKGQRLTIRIIDNGTGRAITWGTKYKGGTPALPTTTVANHHHIIQFLYEATSANWDAVSVSDITY